MGILDLFYPKRCVACKKIGSYLCDDCFSYLSFETKSICLICNRPSFNGLTHPGCRRAFLIDGLFSSIPYNKTAQKLIYNFKYKPYLTDIKKVLSDLFYEGLIQNENFMREISPLHQGGSKARPWSLDKNRFTPSGIKEWVLVPIPLYKTKLKKRGYNQSEILSQELAKRFSFPIQNLLKRTKNTKAQFGLNRKEREKNIKNAFILKSSIINLKSKNVLLIDDLATTGSTLSEAANVLKRNGVKRVIGLTLARD